MSPSYETTLKEQYQITSTSTTAPFTGNAATFWVAAPANLTSGIGWKEITYKQHAIQLIRNQPFF